jgi:phage-related protein
MAASREISPDSIIEHLDTNIQHQVSGIKHPANPDISRVLFVMNIDLNLYVFDFFMK